MVVPRPFESVGHLLDYSFQFLFGCDSQWIYVGETADESCQKFFLFLTIFADKPEAEVSVSFCDAYFNSE